jgi:hypothetical protein
MKKLKLVTPDPSTSLRAPLDPVYSKKGNNYNWILPFDFAQEPSSGALSEVEGFKMTNDKILRKT